MDVEPDIGFDPRSRVNRRLLEKLHSDEIGLFSTLVLLSEGESARIEEMFNVAPCPGGWVCNGGAIMDRLDEYAHSISGDLPEWRRRAYVAASIVWEAEHVRTYSEFLASCYHDGYVGGAFDFLQLSFKSRLHPDGRPHKRAIRKLRSPSAVRQFVRRGPDLERAPWARAIQRLRRQPQPRRIPDLSVQLADKLRTMAEFSCLAGYPPVNITAPTRGEKKMVRRSAECAAGVVGEEAARRFALGERVRISGEHFDWHFNRNVLWHLLHKDGHHLECALTLPDGSLTRKLANLCVFVEGSPPLDQLAAFGMFIASGEELTLIDSGNLSSPSAEGLVHPMLAGKFPIDKRDMCVYEANRKRYEVEMLPLYTDALWSQMWGSCAGRTRRQLAAAGRPLPDHCTA